MIAGLSGSVVPTQRFRAWVADQWVWITVVVAGQPGMVGGGAEARGRHWADALGAAARPVRQLIARIRRETRPGRHHLADPDDLPTIVLPRSS